MANASKYVHGQSNGLNRDGSVRYNRTYGTWQAMKGRCNNPHDAAYKDYGGRGITVCKEWNKSFVAFRNDMGDAPEGLSLDRIDNSRGYYKENCRWASAKQQSDNKRKRTRMNEDYLW